MASGYEIGILVKVVVLGLLTLAALWLAAFAIRRGWDRAGRRRKQHVSTEGN